VGHEPDNRHEAGGMGLGEEEPGDKD
jgi:hypothetical protein